MLNTIAATQPKSTTLDFAYPQKVSRASMEALKTSLASDNPQATVRALIDYTLAQGSISPKNVPSAISLIDSVASLQATAPVTRAMLRTLQATIYENVYGNERWKFDRRSLPLSPLPVDMNEWSGQQFREVITRLYNEALTDSIALASTMLSDWTSVVQQDRMTAIYYPTLLDFVATKAIETYSGWSNEPAYFPYTLVRDASDINKRLVIPSLKRAPDASRVLELYAMLIGRSRSGSAPDINYRLGRLGYMLDNSVDDGNDWATRRYNSFCDLYRSFCDRGGKPVSEYVGDILLQLPLTPKHNKSVYTLINGFLKDYPRYWRADCLKNTLADLSSKEIMVEGPENVAPGRETTFRVIMRNVTDASLKIYDVSSSRASRDNYTLTSASGLKQVAAIPLKAKGTVPFSDTLEVTHVFPACGAFIAVPSAQGAVISKSESYAKIRVSELAMVYNSLKEHRDLWTVSAEDGKPIGGVKISIIAAPFRDNSATVSLGATDSGGRLTVPASSRGRVTAARGTDKFASPLYIGDYTTRDPELTQKRATAYTSLPLYHHGDTVAWSAICYESKGSVCRPRAGEEISVVLRDANYQNCDTLKRLSDRFGRIDGSFTLPSEGLSGHYSLLVDGMTSATFEVSDYKLPTFRVLPSQAANDTPSIGYVTLNGKVLSYSGFPIQGADVKISLSVRSGWRWGRSYEVETFADSTDSHGEYSLVIPAEVFQTSPLPKGYYTASVNVTSTAGETQTATVSFSRGKRYIISATTPAHHSLVNKDLSLTASVYDYSGSTVEIPVSVWLSKGSDTLRHVTASPHSAVNLDNVAQGIYILTFACAEADTVRREIILYDPTALTSPCPDKLLWTPEATVTTDLAGRGSWLVAASRPTHILATLSTTDSIISQQWIAATNGFNRLPVELPQGVDRAMLTYTAIGDHRSIMGAVNVMRKDSENGLRIVTETFRDRFEPGATETVTFRVIDLKGHGRETAVIAGMYNAAINAVAPAEVWAFTPVYSQPNRLYLNIPYMDRTWSTFRSFKDNISRRKCPDLSEPVFNTWGRPFSSYLFGRIRVYGTYYKSAMRATAKAEGAEAEEVVYDVVEQMSYDSAAPSDGVATLAENEVKSVAGGVQVTEEAMADVENDADAGNSGVMSVDNEPAPFTYREAAAPLAFFRPDLVTDSDGKLALKFTLPDANATWRMQLLALTDSLLSADFSRELTVARRLMVQPNLPRFVRAGDTAVIPVTVMNSADTIIAVKVSLECFDPSTGKTIANTDSSVEIPANASTVSSITVKIPDGISSLGFRTKAVSELGSDGEQSLLPVLPSLTVVTETVPFYMAPGGGAVSLKVPGMPRGGRVSLQVNSNPVWSVVTALPGLITEKAVTSPEAARAIFAASVASGIVKDNQEIARVLGEWTARGSKTDELTSMLERNTDLKIMLLNATPWISDANDDTQRMRRLALLFDTKLIDKTLNDNIALLSRLTTTSGGWKWSPQSDQASEWASAQVLDLMGRLNELGYFPDSRSLRDMISKALASETALTLKQFKKYPDGNYSDYVWRHTLFASLGFGAPDQAIVNATTRRILSDWRKASLTVKALDARILDRHGYQAVARSILESISEFAVSDPSRGISFPSLTENGHIGSTEVLSATAFILETFARIEPLSAETDGIRQWLILSKSAQNWGKSTETTDIVASVLTSSRRWIDRSSNAEIKVDGRRIPSAEIDRITGQWDTSLDARRVSGKKVKVEVKADSPSWGALYCSYEAPGDSVKSQACPELSITRTLLPSADSLAVGQRVTVLLTVKVSEDMDYVIIDDQRGACFEPVDQLPATVWVDGVRAYRVSTDTSTRFFIDRLRRGTYQLTYDVYVNNAGTYTSGIATAQSQYAPRFTAHSSGSTLNVK